MTTRGIKYILLYNYILWYRGYNPLRSQNIYFFSVWFQAFLSCQLGVSSVGYSMVGYAAASLFGSPVFGYLERYVGRPPLITGAAVINAGLLLLLKLWSPELHPEYLLYIIPVLWGLADAVWMTTVSGR